MRPMKRKFEPGRVESPTFAASSSRDRILQAAKGLFSTKGYENTSTVAISRQAGQLRADLHLEAVRSALMGMLEGLMRDQLLARRAGYPAHYSSKELMEIFGDVLESFTLSSARIA